LVAATADIEKQLAWERRQRPRAGVAALLGAIGLIVYLVIAEMLARDAPTPGFMESLQRALQPGLLAKETSLQVPVFEYLHDHAALVLGGGISGLVSYLGVGWAVAFLGASTHPRNPSLPRWAVLLPLVGGGLTGLGSLLLQISSYTKASSFLDGPRTVAEATATPGLLVFAKLLGLLGTVTLAAGIVLVSLNAMRAGLLTRFYGVLGILTGAIMVILPLAPVVEIFWLLSLAALFFGIWPGGMPPAWSTGRAEPWPSNRPPPRGRAVPQPAQPGQAATEPKPVVRSSARGKRKKR
jgi:hypothetical protein